MRGVVGGLRRPSIRRRYFGRVRGAGLAIGYGHSLFEDHSPLPPNAILFIVKRMRKQQRTGAEEQSIVVLLAALQTFNKLSILHVA